MDKHFKKKARVDGLLGMSPGDERFRALVLSNEKVFPPPREAEEEADELKRMAFASYDDATTPEEFSAAQVQNKASLAKLELVEEQQGVFDEVSWRLDEALALRLVALVQPSSARMERIFSQLKLTLDAVGSSCLEKTLEARLFVRENAALWRKLEALGL
jgi:hypothetical protein